MLIVNNGAFKTGSTWLDRIVRHIVRPKPIPDRFQNPGWVHQSIAPELFEQFLSEVDATEADYVSKNHIRDGKIREVLLAQEHVRVLNITRDIRDTLVSAYYHDQRHGHASGEIADYWQDLGRRRVQQILQHHRLWNTGHSQVFVTSYEGLQASFPAHVEALATFLGVSDVDPARLAEATSFSRMRRSRPGSHMRKGIVGDWRNHLSPEILEELAEMSASSPPGVEQKREPLTS